MHSVKVNKVSVKCDYCEIVIFGILKNFKIRRIFKPDETYLLAIRKFWWQAL